jgi:hypothetical protein
MNNVTFFLVPGIDGVEVEFALIDRGNEEFTSMLKSTYDAQLSIKPKKTIAASE